MLAAWCLCCSGLLPPSWANMTGLQILSLYQNNLTGECFMHMHVSDASDWQLCKKKGSCLCWLLLETASVCGAQDRCPPAGPL